MLITQIVKVSNSKSKVYLDQEFAFLLYIGEIRRYQIKEGEELSEETYRQLMEEVLPKRAKLRCMHLLEARDYTVWELCDKMRQGGYPETVREEAIAYVSSFGYLDDARYTERYIRSYSGQKSRRRIQQELFRKGIDKELMERVWQQEEEQNGQNVQEEEEALIQKLLAKKKYIPEASDDKERRRLYAMLARKGFDGDAIARALR
jgi:regulatory protein